MTIYLPHLMCSKFASVSFSRIQFRDPAILRVVGVIQSPLHFSQGKALTVHMNTSLCVLRLHGLCLGKYIHA